jgi:arylsulfatase
MEVYAGFLEHTDYHVGRLVDALADLGVLDDTLVYYIVGDNGASAEGTPNGTFNEMMTLNGVTTIETPEFLTSKLDLFGTPDAYNHYAVGWAHAMDTPYQWTKQVASHWGGTRNGTIVHWPAGIRAKGEIRSQFSHVIDVAATVLDAAGVPEPTFVHGVQQVPIQGRSMRPTFDDGTAAEHRATQYFEMFVNRGIYHEGWTAVTRHSTPWVMAPLPPIEADTWELYGPDDWTQAHDLAGEQPERLAYLQRLFLIEATKNNVLPLDDRRVERFNADLAGRPSLIRGNSQVLFGGMGRLTENSVLNIKNKSHAVTAQIVVPDGMAANGVLISQGGAFGGWAVYALDGRPAYCYNLFGIQRFKVLGDAAIPSGEHQVRMEFTYDGGGLAKGGSVTLYLDGAPVGQGRVEVTEPMMFSGDETTDVGLDSATPVSDDYGPRDSKFNGHIRWIQIDLGDDAEDADHLITPEERYRVAMARQ